MTESPKPTAFPSLAGHVEREGLRDLSTTDIENAIGEALSRLTEQKVTVSLRTLRFLAADSFAHFETMMRFDVKTSRFAKGEKGSG